MIADIVNAALDHAARQAVELEDLRRWKAGALRDWQALMDEIKGEPEAQPGQQPLTVAVAVLRRLKAK